MDDYLSNVQFIKSGSSDKIIEPLKKILIENR